MRPAFAVVGSPLGLIADADANAEVYSYGVVDADAGAAPHTGADACAGAGAGGGADDPLSLEPVCFGAVLCAGRSSGPRSGFAEGGSALTA